MSKSVSDRSCCLDELFYVQLKEKFKPFSGVIDLWIVKRHVTRIWLLHVTGTWNHGVGSLDEEKRILSLSII